MLDPSIHVEVKLGRRVALDRLRVLGEESSDLLHDAEERGNDEGRGIQR